MQQVNYLMDWQFDILINIYCKKSPNFIGTPGNSMMRVLSGALCTDARPYLLQIEIGTRTTSTLERSHC